MGMFKNQIPRLLGKKFYNNADLLCQELVSVFQSDEPIEIDSPLQISQSGSQTPIQITMNPVNSTGDFGAPLTVNVGGGDTVDIPQFPAGTTVPPLGGTYDPIPLVLPNAPLTPDPYPTDPLPPNPNLGDTTPVTQTFGGSTGGGVGLYGEVASGSGRTYVIDYIKADGTPATGTFTMPTLHVTALVPAGTAVCVFDYPTAKKFVVPVWV